MSGTNDGRYALYAMPKNKTKELQYDCLNNYIQTLSEEITC